ncbi:MAG: hypothetical protein QOD75_1933 [Blastocatellia bacterium]|nr:hypothetical protein [Blastocatellia bacterium]
MSTASTKSSRKRKEGVGANPAGKPAAPLVADAPTEMSRRTWLIASAGVMLVAAFLRLYDLNLVPLHHDEGVNGNFLVPLVRQGARYYHYDPTNYHGPTLYFLSAIIPWVTRFLGGNNFGDKYGLTTFNIRLVTVLFGLGTVWLVLLLRRNIGSIGALSAAGMLAISPGAVYLSRYFIHETLFVFFALGAVVAVLKYYETTSGSYLVLAGISAGMMTATKETWIINGPVILLALISTTVYFWLHQQVSGKPKRKPGRQPPLVERLSARLEPYGGAVTVAIFALVAMAFFFAVNILFYSSFFKNYPKGVNDALLTLQLWSKRTQEHVHSWAQYLEWLREEESPLLILGAVGAAISVWRANNRFALFIAQWGFGSLVAYSMVGYKTPWIALNFIVPLAITAGYLLDVLYRKFEEPLIPLALAIGAIAFLGYEINLRQNWFLLIPVALALAYIVATFYFWSKAAKHQDRVHFYLTAAAVIAVSGAQMFALNFKYYDDDRYTYVYAHTRRDLLALVDEVNSVVARSGSGADTGVTIVSPDYWPLPWYFRDMKRVGYYGRMSPSTEPVVIGSTAQEAELRATFGDRYLQVRNPASPNGSYALRPGVDLLLYVRRDLVR